MIRKYSARIIAYATAVLIGLPMVTFTLHADETSGSVSESSLETIVVTAQKRSENLQDVPISVSVISGKALEDMKVTNLTDLSSVIPNVQLNYLNLTPNSATYMIRGIGTADQDGYVGSAVSIVVDGVPQIFNAGNEVDLFDIDRVEIFTWTSGNPVWRELYRRCRQYRHSRSGGRLPGKRHRDRRQF
jgi:iron complex outermembrane recepter protein